MDYSAGSWRRVLVILSAALLLALVTLAGNGRWFGELSSLENNPEELIVLVVDEDRVLHISTSGSPSNPDAAHVVFADAVKSGSEFSFEIDEQVGLVPAVRRASSTAWRIYYREDRGIVIQKPASGPSLWIPEEGVFRLSSITSRDKTLSPGRPVEMLGLEFEQQEQGTPPPVPRAFGGVGSALKWLALLAFVGLVLVAMRLLWGLRIGATASGLRVTSSDRRESFDERMSLFDSFDEFNDFVAQLRSMNDPAAAIRLAFAYAEAGPGRLDHRELKETPSEWAHRINSADPELARLLSPILGPYLRVRFAGWPATAAAQLEAIDGLVSLVEEASGLASNGPATQ